MWIKDRILYSNMPHRENHDKHIAYKIRNELAYEKGRTKSKTVSRI